MLFVDLVGFTARSDSSDPEDVRDVLQAYHSRVKAQIERFGGSVEKFIGDAVMAVFGAPLAHTDDPERAVRAGLAALSVVGDVPGAQQDAPLIARGAVNTGEAVVAVDTEGQQRQAMAMGDVVNTASRMQNVAPPGGLVVGTETYEATRDVIRYQELQPVQVKGKAKPVNVWLAVEPVLRPAERVARRAPMVGRERELALLESIWDRAVSDRRPHLVTVYGPPGIGKSRLARELALRVEHTGGRVIRGRCPPYGTRDVYSAFGEQVKSVAEVFEQDDAETSRLKISEALSEVVPDDEWPDIVRSLSLMLGLGTDSPVDERVLLFFSARRLVECLGDQQPSLFIFEDVHWADDALLDLVEYLAAHARDAPVVLIALARPEFADRHPGWGRDVQTQAVISLDPVAPDAAVQLVRVLLASDDPERVGRVVARAEGNPLFLEELTAAVIEGSNPGETLPNSVRAAIAGRIDALPEAHRSALLAASVVGPTFWQGTLEALDAPHDLQRLLDSLEAKDLIRRQAVSRVRGDVEYRFKHALIRDVCYATLPRGARRRAHEAVALYIEGIVGENDRDLAWILAHHWEQSGHTEQAAAYLLIAAERAVEALAQVDAIGLFDRALELAADDDTKTHIRLLRTLAKVTFEDFDGSVGDLETLIPALEGRDLVEALLALARSCHWTERTDAAITVAQRALDAASLHGASDLVPPAMARLSQAHAMRGTPGDLDVALDLGERAVRDWVSGVRPEDLAEHEHLLGDQHYWTGDYERALELSRAARDRAVDPSSAEARLRGGGMEGLLLTGMGHYEEAIGCFDSVIALGRDMGRPIRVLLNYSTIAYRELLDFEESRRRSEEALSAGSRSSSFHMPWMNAAVDIVHCDLLSGDLAAAEGRWKDLWPEVLATPAWERWLLGGKLAAFRAELALALGDAEDALEWASKALKMAGATRRRKYEQVARSTLGAAWLSVKNGDQALRELRAATELADSLGSPFGRWRTKARLGRALYTTGDDAGAERELSEAAVIIRGVAVDLSEERAAQFLGTPDVARLLRSEI